MGWRKMHKLHLSENLKKKNRQLEIPTRRWNLNIKMDLNSTRDVWSIHFDYDRKTQRVVVNTVINFGFRKFQVTSLEEDLLASQKGLRSLLFSNWVYENLTNTKFIYFRYKIIIIIQIQCYGYSQYTGCNRRNVRDFGRVFLMLNYTDITQNTYIQSWTVTEITAIEMCGLLGCRRTVGCRRTLRRPWRHTCPLRPPGYETC